MPYMNKIQFGSLCQRITFHFYAGRTVDARLVSDIENRIEEIIRYSHRVFDLTFDGGYHVSSDFLSGDIDLHFFPNANSIVPRYPTVSQMKQIEDVDYMIEQIIAASDRIHLY